MSVSSDDGCRLWTDQRGQGSALVLCHGGPGMWDYLDDLAGLLDDTAHVIRWDQRGCGRSQRSGPYTVARFVADLDAVREQLAGPRMALLGHSWGAHVALRYAIEHPDRVSHLVYVSGTGIDPNRGWHPHYKRNLRRRLGSHLDRWEALSSHARTPSEEREWAVLQWSADFADHSTALRHAERMATPWLGINYDCSQALNAEVKQGIWAALLASSVAGKWGRVSLVSRWVCDACELVSKVGDGGRFEDYGLLPWWRGSLPGARVSASSFP